MEAMYSLEGETQKMDEGQIKQQLDNRRIKFPLKWVVPVVCILIIFGVISFANYQKTLSAGTVQPATMGEPVGQSAGGPSAVGQVQIVQEIEKTARSTDKLAKRPSIWPVQGEITSRFGWRNSPWGDGSEFHPGIDIANNMETPIVATADGEVVQTGWSGGYGNIVKINHGDGIETIYGHNSRIAVSAGQSVQKGQVIAYLGNTGRSTGPHAHYEVRVNGNAVDPVSFLVLY